MNAVTNFEFLVGVAAGKILLGAVVASPLFRNLTLAAAAVALCFTYMHGGVSEIISIANKVQTDLFTRPNFAKGLAARAVVAFLVFGVIRNRGAL